MRFSGLSPKPRSSDEKNEEEAPIVRIDDVAFVFRYYNPQFTYMELTSRFVFFILTEFVTVSKKKQHHLIVRAARNGLPKLVDTSANYTFDRQCRLDSVNFTFRTVLFVSKASLK